MNNIKNRKAFTIAAVRSGEGKTTLTLGIMAALVKRGIKVQPFKIGPDFIDPSLHKLITGKTSYNLDLKMMGSKCCLKTFVEKSEGSEISVLEGVMGLFDGNKASSAETTKLLGIPVFLIIDAKSCAESAVAILNGFKSYDEELEIAGVIFNKIGSDRHKELIQKEIEKKCNLPVIGYIKRDSSFEIPERHLGLVMEDDKVLQGKSIETLITTIEHSLDLDLLLSKCRFPEAKDSLSAKKNRPTKAKNATRLAIASDESFCFYYAQNIELMEEAGFEVVFFSPMYDSKLPSNTDMIYLGGGYPELHAEILSKNKTMLDDIKNNFERDIPIYGECGGFMYLCDSLIDLEGNVFQMTSIFPFQTIMNKRLRKLGYRKTKLLHDGFLGMKGDTLHGHEFHYSHVVENSFNKTSKQPAKLYSLDNNSYEGYIHGSALGSYVHLHFGRTPDIVTKMYESARMKGKIL